MKVKQVVAALILKGDQILICQIERPLPQHLDQVLDRALAIGGSPHLGRGLVQPQNYATPSVIDS